jgi:hypothetical protein
MPSESAIAALHDIAHHIELAEHFIKGFRLRGASR